MKKLNILIVSAFYPAGPIPFLAQAFERMGCNVVRVGPTYNDHGGIDWGKDAVSVSFEIEREWPEWKIDKYIDWTTQLGKSPDFVFLSEENYQTHIVPTDKISTAYYSLDGWPNCFARGDALNPTVKYTNQPRGIRIHPREETPDWHYLPGAADSKIHIDKGLKRDVDFVLHATPYGSRPMLCEEIEKAGFTVRSGFVPTSEFVLGYNRGLCTYCNVNGNGHEIKWRFWEGSAMGCVNIIDHSILLERLGFLPYEHYIPIGTVVEENDEPWPTPEMLIEKISLLKKNKILVEYVSSNAQKLTLEKHTYEARARVILSDLGFDF